MTKILIIAEHDHKELKPSTLHTAKAALSLGKNYDVFVGGENISSIADQASKLDGATTILKSDCAALSHLLAENTAPLIASLIKEKSYDAVLAPATTFGKNLMPRIAALCDVSMLSDITAVHSEKSYERPIYAGNVIAKVETADALKIMTVRSTAFDAVGLSGKASIEDCAAATDKGQSSFVSQELSKSERPELTAAKIIISGGRGMGSADNFSMIDRIADKLGAAIGASRAAVDAGYVPNDYQVGQTGKIVAPNLYIAIGISGAIQHLAGMKDSKIIVAINKDEDAPIFQIADYGLVGDLFQILPELEEKLDSYLNQKVA